MPSQADQNRPRGDFEAAKTEITDKLQQRRKRFSSAPRAPNATSVPTCALSVALCVQPASISLTATNELPPSLYWMPPAEWSAFPRR
jgi:hypothetical protein